MSEIEDILKDGSAWYITDDKLESTADLITRLNAKAIVEAYRAGKEAGEAERDRLREAIKTHRRNIWGAYGAFTHPQDRALYAALQEADDE
jgi:hypothetical protein